MYIPYTFFNCQVTFIYIVLLTIVTILSKQLYSIKYEK